MAKRTMERDWKEQTVTILGKVYDYGVLTPEMKDMCGFLGFGTKLVDNLAGMKAYTPEEKLERVDKVYTALKAGNWRIPGEGVQSMKKKLEAAKEKATPEELAVMERLGLLK